MEKETNVQVLSSSASFGSYFAGVVKYTEFVVWEGRDPFTLPHTSFEWKNDGWLHLPSVTVHKQFLHSKVTVQIWGPTIQDAQGQVAACLREAAIIGALAGIAAAYASSGTAGISTALGVFSAQLKSCLSSKAQADWNQLKVLTHSDTYWEPWT